LSSASENVTVNSTGEGTATVADTGSGSVDTGDAPCETLFGLPNAKTGLGPSQCVPQCTCGGKNFVPPTYTEADIQALEAMVLRNPFDPLPFDPYSQPQAHEPSPGAVCGLLRDATNPQGYFLHTYESTSEAKKAGAFVTHYDACGLCSPLTDLAVYMRHPDLTDPVRQCGLQSTVGGEKKNIQCLQALGFDYPCAQIWYYNTKHTQSKCLAVCLAALSKPYHNPDGTLNACMLCDEEKSGQVFKAVAGRTRRNTGLPSSMCRPCSEVLPVFHNYQ
jgi:hypothetical protein